MPSPYAEQIYRECPALEAMERRARGRGLFLPPQRLIAEADEGEEAPAKKKKDWSDPTYRRLSPGSTNPKTAKHPDTEQTYLGALLHLDPYAQSGRDTCPFATAIYKITVADLDPERLGLVQASPGYEESEDGHHTFLGLEDRRSNPEKYGKEVAGGSETYTCPSVMIIRLPGANTKDWTTGPKIRVARSEMLHTELVGGCANACLNSAGNVAFAREKASGRRDKTDALFSNRDAFLGQLLLDLVRLADSAARQGHKGVVRLNATSDIKWEEYRFPEDAARVQEILSGVVPNIIRSGIRSVLAGLAGREGSGRDGRSRRADLLAGLSERVAGRCVMDIFPDIQFYDYTKDPGRVMKSLRGRRGEGTWPENYYLILSLAEDNRNIALRVLREGGTVAAVFNVANFANSKGDFPKKWYGFPVLDADEHDYRFLDTPGCVAGLRSKGEAKFRETNYGFVIEADDEGLDQSDPAVIAAREYIEDWERRRGTGELVGRPGQKNAEMRDARHALKMASNQFLGGGHATEANRRDLPRGWFSGF